MQGDGTGAQVELAVDEFALRFVGQSRVIDPSAVECWSGTSTASATGLR